MFRKMAHLKGVVLHSTDTERLRLFYQKLLGKEFALEKSEEGLLYSSCLYKNGVLLEFYPSKDNVTPASPDLVFRIPQIEDVKYRMGKYFENILTRISPDLFRCNDSNNRKIYLQQDQSTEEVSLEEVIIHSKNIDKLNSFYCSLLNLESEKQLYEEDKNYIFRLAGCRLRISFSENEVSPSSPDLLFCTSQLDYADATKKFKDQKLHGKMPRIFDPEGREIII